MRMLALGGVAGPAIFTVVVIVVSSLREPYSHANNFISELGASSTPHANLMNYAGFIPAGLLLAGFGVALGTLLPRSRRALAVAALVTLFGAGIVMAGIFSCDAGCPQGTGSLENIVHDRIAPPTFLSFIAGIAIFGLLARRLPAFRHLATYSLLTSALALVFLIALVSSLDTRSLTGLWQRLMLAVLFLWCARVGLTAARTTTTQ
jgi:hypothetical membrane protein